MQCDVPKLLVITPPIITEVKNTNKGYDKVILSLLSLYVIMEITNQDYTDCDIKEMELYEDHI